MKKINISLACIVITLCCQYECSAETIKDFTKIVQEIGRYQLFQGQYTTYDLKRQQTSTTNSVFLLDTATGQVKRFVNKIDENGKYTESWMPTDNSVSEKKSDGK